jgi:tRNA dimethylallyltransferase
VPALRAELDAVAARDGTAALHARLSALDPVSAARLHPHDRVRIVRALEVAIESGQPLSAWQTAHQFSEAPFDVFCAGLAVEPSVLTDRIAARVDDMLARGWLEEVAALVAGGLADEAPAWRTLGYRELRSVARGDLTLTDATVVIRRATARFAARQRTWFRREPDVRWYEGGGDPTALRDAITTFLATAGPARAS